MVSEEESQLPREPDTRWPHFKEVFMVSALTGDGVADLRVGSTHTLHTWVYLLMCSVRSRGSSGAFWLPLFDEVSIMAVYIHFSM